MLKTVNGVSGYRGFTLMEIMIALAIMSILVAIAMPNFTEILQKGRRPDGKVILLDIADKQEQFYTANVPNSYTDDLADLGYTSPQPSEEGHYSVTLVATPAGCAPGTVTPCAGFTLTAAAVGGQASDVCGDLTLDNFGVKGRSGTVPPFPPVSECW